MTVRELIEELKKFDGDLEVRMIHPDSGWPDYLVTSVESPGPKNVGMEWRYPEGGYVLVLDKS